jgi:hypothetical protein
MIGRLLSKEETNAALVVALSGTINGAGGQGAGFPSPLAGCCPGCCRTRFPARSDGHAATRPSRRSARGSPPESDVKITAEGRVLIEAG